MDSNRDTMTSDDLSSLAWVQEELRKSLDAAHKALRRFLKEFEGASGSDVDDVDPAVLRTARQQLHQGVGALELVGMPAAATLLRASEAAVQRFVQKPQKLNAAAVEAIERASFGLLDYLSRVLSGKKVSPVSLFPQYRDVQELAGADRVHPADLWNYDWRWAELPAVGQADERQADEATKLEIEKLLLALMRGSAAAATQMSELCAGLAAGRVSPQVATFWRLASAFFEGQAKGVLRSDLYTKRVASRILAQFGMLERGESAVSERLAQDLLFFCTQCTAVDPAVAPRLASVRQVYGLDAIEPVDYEVSYLGRFDPALLTQARKRVAAAKDSWSAVAGGEMHRLSGLNEQFTLVGESLRKIYPAGEALAQALQHAVQQTVESNASPAPSLAMEVATSVLYLEASLEDLDFDHPDQESRTRRLAERIEAVRGGAAPEPLEPWMEELYRRVSDRQTMGSVVQELRSALTEAEKHIDQFFRNPADRSVLLPVPGQLTAMRGVLSVLGMDQASQAVLKMREVVDELIATEVDPVRAAEAGTFDRLAGNLGALGFLIDMLSYQPQMAKSLFRYDAEQGELRPVMGRSDARRDAAEAAAPAPTLIEPRLIEQAQTLGETVQREDVPLQDVSEGLLKLSQEAIVADQPALAASVVSAQAAVEQAARGQADAQEARAQVAQAMADFVATASDASTLEPLPPAPVPAPAPVAAPAPAAASGLEEDDEMREVFLEEAREVMANAHQGLRELQRTPDDLEQLTLVRRSFHTLKGSSRMVGLNDFGEAAWACEQLYNAWLADQRPASEDLLGFTGEALAYLGAWVEEIAAGAQPAHQPAPVRAAADALRLEGRRVPLAADAVAPAVAEAAPVVAAEPAPAPATVPESVAAPEPLPELSLDLGAFEGGAAEPAPAPVAEAADLSLDIDLPADAPALPEVETLESFDLPTEPSELATSTVPAELPPLEVSFDLDLGALEGGAPAAVTEPEQPPAAPEPAAAPVAEAAAPEAPAAAEEPSSDQVKVVGPLRIAIPLFNIYLNEADELSRRLTTEVAEWAMELHRPIGETPIALAHSLAGSSSTVGFADLSQLARRLEHALMRSQAIGRGTPEEARLFVDVAEEIRRLLHQFAAGFLKEPQPELLERLAQHEVESARLLEEVNARLQRDDVPSTGGLERPEETLRIEVDAPQDEAALPVDLALPDPSGPPAGPAAEVTAEAVPVEPAPVVPAVEPPVAPQPAPAVEPVAAAPAPAAPATSFAPLTIGQAEFRELTDLDPQAPPATHVTGLPGGVDIDDDIDAVDVVDPDLFPIFEEEGQELLPQLAAQMRDWLQQPQEARHAHACMRTLHTFKGGARLAGAMRLGEMAHRLETAIEKLLAGAEVTLADVEPLQGRVDALAAVFEALRSHDAQAYAEATAAVQPLPVEAPAALVEEHAPEGEFHTSGAMPLQPEPAPAVPAEAVPAPEAPVPAAEPQPAADAGEAIDWSRFLAPQALTAEGQAAARPAATGPTHHAAVRVRAQLLDRLVNQAGEVSITRARLESEVSQIKGSLNDLTDNLERLRQQLRDIELQAETQMTSRMEAAKAEGHAFDPLEFDRFTRFQELTRMMAESVNDVATVQRTLQRALQVTEDELAAQARLTRELQDDLLRTRMVEFEGLSERLYRVVRLAAKETGKQVRLDIIGGSIEIDRGVLERMTASFEHLLRNCVTHGIESPQERAAKGKDPVGTITVSLHQEGNEVSIEFRDDGAGLDLAKIRNRAVQMKLLAEDARPGDAELANLIFTPGFSTAETVTGLAGRGIGMDVVRSDVNAMGGRIETATRAGQGTSFKLVVPLTTAVTQVVMMRCGQVIVGVPSNLVEIVRRGSPEELAACYESGVYTMGGQAMPFFWLGALLQSSPRGTEIGRTVPIIVIRSAQQRIALHVDEVLGNQEVVVKNLGPQLSRLPGLAGMTLLASGAVALIYNPVALATVYGEEARAMTAASLTPQAQAAAQQAAQEAQPEAPVAPLVLVVDDSLTVRRVTQRLLAREGYRVVVAKDGLEALERLAEERPAVVLSDIEMPRMDGFDLVRNIRGDARLAHLPVIMITSRIAQKHRDYAAELGVNHYLGKPYSEEELLALIRRYTAEAEAVPASA
ncbi:Hpt domain-containing protein [Caldimonas thermodepolymerans]|uniref:Chemotaxis protein CheA n=1 Tax=Caldimonas thermodepolymerans TaxID=215580 RepID=A0AA46DH07_9BURK|nr:Hpt domain-containing protein [Caldimonas thermodepolymerans]TCP09032.1 chemosensory pili system protein ChpA (sensor histidine kinase/response regulator) [Caldimonas thermodepolymerans]UZG47332.1 Hpt domain-containing protein [Caldimonas thermodepolymerans]